MRILIINLTRLGDIIQSLGLVKGLKNKYFDAEIDFLAMSSFSGILENFEGIKEVITLNDSKLVDEIEQNFWEAYLEINHKLEYLNQKNYDLLVNPVISIQSSYFAYLINAKEKRGMIFTKDKEQGVYSDWSSYLLANQHHIGEHSINLVNIFAGTANTKFDIEDYRLQTKREAYESIKRIFQKEVYKSEQQSTESFKIIGIHIGASQSNKCWDSTYFKDLIIRLTQNKRLIVLLFGGYKEKDIADFFNDFQNPQFFNWIGRFNLNELIAAISECHLFICNDTGPMHIAASGKIPIINISLGPVSMWETGPYSLNSLVIQANIDCHPCNFNYLCSHHQCHHQIKVDHIISAVNYNFFKQPVESDTSILYWKAISDFDGFIHWVPIEQREISKRELLFECKRVVWASILRRENRSFDEIIEHHMAFLKEYYNIGYFDFKEELSELHTYNELIGRIIKSLKEILDLSQYQKNSLDKIKFIWSDVKKNKSKLFNKAQQYSVFYDWFLFISFSESSSDEGDLFSLCQQSINQFKRIQDHLSLLRTMLIAYQ